MGSFSWTRAEATTKRSNITYGDKYKILVPKEFGGGYIKDIYFDYGRVFDYKECAQAAANSAYCCYIDGNGAAHDAYPVSDLYGILAYWNNCPNLSFDGEDRPQTMDEILLRGRTNDQDNRCEGINIGCYDDNIDALKFPLKLVSASYRGTYEECRGRSYGDPNQGFGKYTWAHNDYAEYLDKLKAAESSARLSETVELDTRSLKSRDLDKDIAEIRKLSCSGDAEAKVLLEEISQLLEKVRALI